MTRRYAEGTTVSVDKSRAEVERILRRFGADAFSSGFADHRAFISFRAKDRFIRFAVALPREGDDAVRAEATRRKISPENALVGEEARRWRSLVLLVKAKMAAIEDGIVSFEREFLANIVMPDGKTVAEHVEEPIRQAYLTGVNVPLLEGPGND